MRHLIARFGWYVAQPCFRRSPHGWAYRQMSLPWPFEARTQYRVTEAQKTKIEAIFGVSHLATLLIFAVALLAVIGGVALKIASTSIALGVFCLFLTVIQYTSQGLAIQRLLKSDPRYAQRIVSTKWRPNPIVAELSTKRIVMLLALSIVFVLFTAYDALLTNSWERYFSLSSMILMLVYFGALLKAKLMLGHNRS